MSSINAISAAPKQSASPELKDAFQRVVGGMFYGQMLKAMRQTVGKPAYIHGGQAEEMFQSQLDQTVVEDLAKRPGGPWVDALFQQFLVQLNDRTASAQPSQFASPVQSATASPVAQLLEAARDTQPAPEGARITTAATALSSLVRK